MGSILNPQKYYFFLSSIKKSKGRFLSLVFYVNSCSNLDETTRAVYKENIRLNEALTYHLKETENLEKVSDNIFLLKLVCNTFR